MRRAAFLDRDGVINIDRGYVIRIDEFEFVPGVLAAARAIAERDYALVIVTNQSGIGRGLYSEDEFLALTQWMHECFAAAGAPLAGVYFCPHHPSHGQGDYRVVCDCRKPAPGMLLQAAKELHLDLSRSILFGDRNSDLVAARMAGVPQRVLLGIDGRADPSDEEDGGEATARFRSLAHAVAAPWWAALPATATATVPART